MAGADTAGFLVVPLLWRCGWMFVTESAVLAPAACTRSAESLAETDPCVLRAEDRRQKTRRQSMKVRSIAQRLSIQDNGQLRNDRSPSTIWYKYSSTFTVDNSSCPILASSRRPDSSTASQPVPSASARSGSPRIVRCLWVPVLCLISP